MILHQSRIFFNINSGYSKNTSHQDKFISSSIHDVVAFNTTKPFFILKIYTTLGYIVSLSRCFTKRPLNPLNLTHCVENWINVGLLHSFTTDHYWDKKKLTFS